MPAGVWSASIRTCRKSASDAVLHPRAPRPLRYRRIRRNWSVGYRRGPSRYVADGITTHDRGRRNRDGHGTAGRMGNLRLARLLGLALTSSSASTFATGLGLAILSG